MSRKPMAVEGSPLWRIGEFVKDRGQPDAGEAERLAKELGLPAATMRGVASYYADLVEATETRVCEGTSCLLCGGKELRMSLEDGGIPCRNVDCLGYCDRSPAQLDPDGEITARGQAHEVRAHCESAIVTRRLASGDAASLATARRGGAYETLIGALTGTPTEVLEKVDRSGLCGRGGAAFPTARKWRSCAETPADKRYVIANGDEGDAGSFVDRLLMEHDPHAVLEGMLLAGFAVGADEGIVFIRSEYPRAIEVMERAINEARDAGFIGRDALGSGLDFEVSVFPGMGSYVCGEETAMINAIEGRRGEVRLRPPYPSESGLFGKPTVVNNVETLANVPYIVKHGGEAYARFGSVRSKGTKALCLNHGFARPGLVEVEFGISLREVIEKIGGGGRDGAPLAAVILGGPMGSVLVPEKWDVPLCYETMREQGIELGHGGLVAVPEDADFRGLLEHWMRFMIDESCGKCAPCRLGSQCAVQTLTSGRSEQETRRRLDELFTAMEQGSLCAFGQLMPGPMRQLIEHFGERIFSGKGGRS